MELMGSEEREAGGDDEPRVRMKERGKEGRTVGVGGFSVYGKIECQAMAIAVN